MEIRLFFRRQTALAGNNACTKELWIAFDRYSLERLVMFALKGGCALVLVRSEVLASVHRSVLYLKVMLRSF